MKNRYYTDRANRLTSKIKSSVCEYNKLIQDLSTELDRLEESEEYHRKGFAELYKRLDDAIEYIKQEKNNIDNYDKWLIDDLLNILQGSDKE